MSKEIQDMGEKVVKAKGKPRGGNSPMIGENGYLLEEGDNNKFTSMGLWLMNLPKIDVHDPEAVEQRLNDYFGYMASQDAKPTVAGMAMALGMDRRRLWEIKTGVQTTNRWIEDLPNEVKDSIKKAYSLMEYLWENYMVNGKINPVTGIFLGKNNFGYQDKQEMVLTPNTQNESDFSEDDLRKRYMIEDGENNA